MGRYPIYGINSILVRRETGRIRPFPPGMRGSVIENSSDLWIAHIRLVIPVEAGIDGLRELLALQRLHRRFDHAGADADRVLGDRARLGAGFDRLDLLLARVIADDDGVLSGLLHAVQHA